MFLPLSEGRVRFDPMECAIDLGSGRTARRHRPFAHVILMGASLGMAMIQVRNVPEDLHRELKIRAAREGLTLSELALNELRRSVAAPSPRELSERFAARRSGSCNGETAAESSRAERDAR